MEILNYNFIEKQKEACAIITMRDMLRKLAIREKFRIKKHYFFSHPQIFMKHFLILIQEFGKKVPNIY